MKVTTLSPPIEKVVNVQLPHFYRYEVQDGTQVVGCVTQNEHLTITRNRNNSGDHHMIVEHIDIATYKFPHLCFATHTKCDRTMFDIARGQAKQLLEQYFFTI